MGSRTPRADALRVVVIGAGYAGMIATNRFLGSLTESEQSRIALTVVNPRDAFVERIRLHELAAGSRESVTMPLTDVLHPDAEVLVGLARVIDPVAKTVRVATAAQPVDLPYDYLIYAVGSVAAASVPGSAQHAFLLGDFDGAASAAEAIRTAGPTPRIAVIGGGFTGVEAAAELAEQHRDAEVTLLCAGGIVPQMRPAARRSLARTLRHLGVDIVEDAEVTDIESARVRTANGQVHEFEVCLVAAAFAVPDLASVSGLPVDGSGRLCVDEHLRCLDEPTIIGAGDAIVAPVAVAAHLRMSCAVALPLGAHAAGTLLATIRGTALPVLSVGFVFQCLSLGRKKGYIQLVRPDDTPRPLHVGGRLGASIKAKICAMVVDSPQRESTRPGTYSWPAGPKPEVRRDR